MRRRPRRNRKGHTIMILSNFRKNLFSAPIFEHGASPAPGGLEVWKPPIKLVHWVVVTPQLLTRIQNFQKILADTPLNLTNVTG